ncbi:MAG: hypothetical protein DMD76_11360, partial [Candidatus Rokuibacteriota bacterium]
AAALGNDAPPARRPAGAREAAALWSVLALAQQALGDHAGARTALEAAIEASPEAERATYRRQLVTLALGVARDLIASSGAHAAPDSESRVGDLRDALAWLDRGRAAAAGDTDLRDLAVTAEALLWPAYEQVVMALVQRQEFPAARRLLREALEHPRVPAAPDRRSETRAALVRAFEGWTETSALAIREVADAGDREAAIVRSDKLWTRLRTALEEGLSERELAGAFTRVRRLFEEIGREPA